MLRRSHKKSRDGCLQCKRRHVKCDENRPRCRLCILSDRKCSFASLSTGDASSQSMSPGDTRWTPPAGVQDSTPLEPIVLVNREPRNRRTINDRPLDVDEPINLLHTELLVHALLNDDMFSFAIGFEKFHRAGLAIGFEKALKAPYLMHQVLAFAACHLAHLNPERSIYYRHQAVEMQTRAVSIFNAAQVQVDQSNCVPILLFSSMLGQHLLADTLARRDPGGIDSFITHYVQCVEMHRGIYTIATSAWSMLMETELEPILSMSKSLTSRQPNGEDTAQVSALVESIDSMGEEEKQACRTAIHYLQIGLDAAQVEDNSPISRYQMICEWTMLVPPLFTELLASKRPVALIVLAHYAVLLHYGRHLWQVGDSGRYILHIIGTYLETGWDHWLEYPRERVLQDVE
ncbi:putative C6 finger domain protein [Decorospora gaudefroyi]|uniref:Putative C6 finger domain protein n=1 Tax=Decorospora gaudefroyi TaxID=184978 RepID=A0A6A5K5B1_9PLEO|nr:putative C6 finger domain protein [Decorospora gaudefroyi]